jgi:hypothetical protein
VRLKLSDFNDHVRNHEKVLIVTRDALRSRKQVLSSGDRVFPADFRDMMEYVTLLQQESRNFYDFIERSNHLPLAVVSLRLPLIMILQEIETMSTSINWLLANLRNESWTTLVLPVEQLFEVNNKLGLLDFKSDEVLDEIGVLLDRARFKEREYSVA